MKLHAILGSLVILGLSDLSIAAPDVNIDDIETWHDSSDVHTETVPVRLSMKAAAPLGANVGNEGWKVTCDSAHAGNPCSSVIDGSTDTFWHSQYSKTANASLPHWIVINLGVSEVINGISALPRQDGKTNGWIAQHSVYVSTDGQNWGSAVASGNWYADSTLKYSNFEPVTARYVKLVAESEVNGTQWTSVSEFKVYKASSQAIGTKGSGRWGPTLDFPIIPVAAVVEPTSGKVIVWSSYKYDNYVNSPKGYTLTAEWDPSTGAISERKMENTGHDMFCPGTSMDGTGQIIVTGGDNYYKTSIFDSETDSWTTGAKMNIGRGYQSSATVSTGSVFTIGGSWSGGKNTSKPGEIYNPAKNKWTNLPNALVEPMLTADPQGQYRADNHAWLFGWKSGTVFQAGPSTAMNWYTTTGEGGVSSAGSRQSIRNGIDPDSMCGNAVMYDAVKGKILTVGGSPAYQERNATTNAHIITIGKPGSKANTLGASNGMYFARIFANAVILPGGQTFITGGQTYGKPFSDENSVLTPEIYDPTTNHFVRQVSNSIPRNYHSVALLLPDATVFSGGGGLCGKCTTNHFDAQIFTPQYLLNDDGSLATRPNILSVSASKIVVGDTLEFTTDTAIDSAALIRYGTTTHTINTDQRRVPLTLSGDGSSWSTALPTDPGILLPGYWMLFVITNGVPSVASTIQITLA